MFVIGGCLTAESAQRQADEQAQPPLCTTVFAISFHRVIKGYSEPLKMPSVLIENEIEHLSQVLARIIMRASWSEQGALVDKDEPVQINKYIN